MDTGRKANREANETTLQYKTRHDALLVEELNDDKLRRLLEFVSRLEKTPPGAAELQRRNKLFGECKRIEGETSGEFFARLRHWLDKSITPKKPRRHASRQAGD